MSHVSKSQRAKIFDLWGARGVATVFAEAADALAEVAEAPADVAEAFTDGVAFCSAFCLLDEVAELGAFVELPHVSLNSRSACSSRLNSSWSGTPCGA